MLSKKARRIRGKRWTGIVALICVAASMIGCRPTAGVQSGDSSVSQTGSAGGDTTQSPLSSSGESVSVSGESTDQEVSDMTTTSFSGDGSGDRPGNSTTTTSQTTNTNPSVTPDPPSFNESVRRICGTFIQPWLIAGWSQARWDEECRMMSQAGMKYIILQSITDLSYNTSADLGQDPDAYTLSSALCLYPSSLPEFRGVNNGVDSLKHCLEACKKYGMQAIIGPVSDNRWWKYGWGMPKCPSGKTDVVKDSYMTAWVKENADISNRVAEEVMEKYGSTYGDQIYGWYYNNEIWNIDVACRGTDRGVYAQILGESMNLVLRKYTSLTPGKPMMLSSFINPSLSTPQQCGKMWTDIFRYTEFRKGDIFSPQDSYGNNPTQDLEAWTKAYADAVKTKSGLLFWSNNENFRANATVATLDSFVYQINTTAKYASANICFSWNHYFSPDQQNKGYNQAYLKYIRTGQLDTQAPTQPKVTVSGKKIVVDSTDNDGLAGIRIYKDGTLVKTVHCRKDNNDAMFRTITLSNSGNYSVETYDFFGNASARTAFTIS